MYGCRTRSADGVSTKCSHGPAHTDTQIRRLYRQMPRGKRPASYIVIRSHDCRNVNKSTVVKLPASGHSGGSEGEKVKGERGGEACEEVERDGSGRRWWRDKKEEGWRVKRGGSNRSRLFSAFSIMTLAWIHAQLLNDKYPGEPIHFVFFGWGAAAAAKGLRNEEHLFYTSRANVSPSARGSQVGICWPPFRSQSPCAVRPRSSLHASCKLNPRLRCEINVNISKESNDYVWSDWHHQR